MAKTLATFRIEENDWNAFKEWADSRGSNASAELSRFVLSALGRLDTSLDVIPHENLSHRIDEYLANNLDSHLEGKLDDCLDKKLTEAIASVKTELEKK